MTWRQPIPYYNRWPSGIAGRNSFFRLQHLKYSQRAVIPSYYQSLVSEVASEHGPALLQESFEYLVDVGVLGDEASAKTPSGARAFGPGSHWQAAIVECDETFLQADKNGVVGRIQRRIIDPGDFHATVICPECLEPREFDGDWRERAVVWVDQSDSTDLTCRQCSTAQPVENWAYDPPVGFGNYSITFWNWPSINREFINQIQRIVGTHVSLIEGKGESISTYAPAGPLQAIIPPAPR